MVVISVVAEVVIAIVVVVVCGNCACDCVVDICGDDGVVGDVVYCDVDHVGDDRVEWFLSHCVFSLIFSKFNEFFPITEITCCWPL